MCWRANMATRKKHDGAEKRPRKLKGREDRADERFRELTAWYTLQGIDEATARRRAREQMRDDDTDDE
jgi:hypothetical protein